MLTLKCSQNVEHNNPLRNPLSDLSVTFENGSIRSIAVCGLEGLN